MTVPYARRLWIEDAALVAAAALVVSLRPGGSLAPPLAGAIVFVLAWGLATLHVPSRVVTTPSGVSFSRYGRTHVFAWREVERVRVRRFLVGDKVLVRLVPSPPWRGRYWMSEHLEGYDRALRDLLAHSSRGSP